MKASAMIDNAVYLLKQGGVMPGKYCPRERNYVDDDYDCETCKVCGDKEIK